MFFFLSSNREKDLNARMSRNAIFVCAIYAAVCGLSLPQELYGNYNDTILNRFHVQQQLVSPFWNPLEGISIA